MQLLNKLAGKIVSWILIGWFLLLCPCGGRAQTAYQLPVSASIRTRSFLQDKYGYVWMATTSGLGRYDGYQMEFFKPSKQGNRSLLPDFRILDIKYWRNRFVWIRTRGNKYSCYDTDRERFVDYTGNGTYGAPRAGYAFLRNGNLLVWDARSIHEISFDGKVFRTQDLDFSSSASLDVVNFIDTPKGGFLVTSDGGVFRRKGDWFAVEYAASLSRSIRTVSRAAYRQGVLYLSTNDGVYEYHVDSRKMQQSAYNPKQASVLTDNRGNVIIFSLDGSDVYYLTSGKTYHFGGVYNARLLQLDSEPRYTFNTSSNGILWISTYGNGLFSFHPSTGELKSYADLMPSPYILSALEDRDGNLWTSMENMGVCIVDARKSTSQYIYTGEAGQVNHANDVRLLKALGNSVYVGDMLNGFYVADSRLSVLRPCSGVGDDVTAVGQDARKRIWAGTRKMGIFVDGKPLDVFNAAGNGKLEKVSGFLLDKKNRMWIALFGKGLDVYENGKLKHVIADETLHLRGMASDRKGYVYLCSDKGALYFNPDKLLRNPRDYQVIKVRGREELTDNSYCACAYVDSKQRVWIGSVGHGLMMIDGKDTLTFSTQDGMVDNNVKSVIEDKRTGDIWIGTEHGVSRWRKGKFTNYYFGDNELSNQCTETSAVCLADGRIAFATHLGIMTFWPSKIVEHKASFPLAITKLEVNGVSVNELDDGEGLEQALVRTKEVTFDYNQNSLTFYFSDFSYSRKEGSSFTYYLEGYDDTWNGVSRFNFAQYRNLPPGKYRLHVRSCNANGVWMPDEAVLTVVVRPPFYATWWAYLIYIALVAVTFYYVYVTLRRINALRTEVKVENQLTEYKLRFFTNISHEFRTPLTIIQGDIERIKTVDKVPGEMKQPLSSMAKSVDRMMRLINQLLEFRKMQNDKLQLALEKTDVIAFLRDIYLSFRNMAEGKGINLMFLPFDKSYEMYVDRNYLDKITYNLLSNAIKYTPAKGDVVLRISLNAKQRLLISVEDTGVGVEKSKQPMLFQRFNRSSYSHDSIGIGLHLTAELVRVHQGEISYADNMLQGSIFRVELPTDEQVYEPKDFMQEDNAVMVEENNKLSLVLEADYQEMPSQPLNHCRVLVAEDDHDVREFLKNELQRYFEIELAVDGQEAWEKLHASKPALLVSDVMMPRMDGYQLLKKVRGDASLSDLPVVLLTALTADDKKLKGLDAGADAYVEKPFHTKVLIAQCCQLLEQRNHLRQVYGQKPATSAKAVAPEIIKDEKDKKFQELLDAWLSTHIADTELNIDAFAESMGYGRTTFYKKIKQITGTTPNDYIRTLRMNRAAELLKDDYQTIAEVGYQVGFSDPYYFSKTFKSFFGISPSKYRAGK